ncbi:MAG: hypothetical protein ACEQSU_14900 [Microgenomates group bacterium]
MTSEMIGGIVRAILSAAGGIILAKGYVDAETWLAISGALTTLAVTVWSVWAKKA